jgi:hypothetical protein
MKVHDPDNEIPDEGTQFRHHEREKSDVVGLSAEETDMTSIEPGYTVKVLKPEANPVAGTTDVEMRVVVEVVETNDPEYLDEGYSFPISLERLKGGNYERLD